MLAAFDGSCESLTAFGGRSGARKPRKIGSAPIGRSSPASADPGLPAAMPVGQVALMPTKPACACSPLPPPPSTMASRLQPSPRKQILLQQWQSGTCPPVTLRRSRCHWLTHS